MSMDGISGLLVATQKGRVRCEDMGAYPLHASTVGLVPNLNTNCMSPQFRVVYDNPPQIVYSAEG